MALLLACGNFHCPGSDPRVAELIIHAVERGGGSAGQWVGEFCPHCIGLGAPASVNSVPAANLRRMRGQCGLNSRQQAQLGTVELRRIGVQGPAGRETAMGPPRSPSPPTFSYRVTQLGGLGDAGREGPVPACVLEGNEVNHTLTLSATDAIGNVIAVGLSGGASQEESNLVRSHARFQGLGVGNDERLSTTEYYYIVRGIHSTWAGGPIGCSRASAGTPGVMATDEILRAAMESARRGHRTSQSSQGRIALSRLAFPAAPLLSLLR